MKAIYFILPIFLIFLGSTRLYSENDGKTFEQIKQESDVVVVAEVAEVIKDRKIDDSVSYYRVSLTMVKIEQGLRSEQASENLTVYFRNATDETTSLEHAPHFKKGDKVRLYLQFKSGILKEGFALLIPWAERVEKLK